MDLDKVVFDKIKKMEAEKAVEVLLSILLTSDSSDWEKRAKAIDNLIYFEDKTHFQEIKSTYLNESFSILKVKMGELLSHCYKKEGIDFLITQYKEERDWKVRNNIIEMVGKGDKKKIIPFLIDALGDPNVECKESAISSLGKLNATEAIIPLIELLQLRNEEIHTVLIDAIVKISKKEDFLKIIEQIEVPIPMDNLNVRKSIPIIIGKIGNKNLVDLLIELLDDENSIVRKNAVQAFEKVVDPNDLNKTEHLIKTLVDDDIKALVRGSIASLSPISPKAFAADIRILGSLSFNNATIGSMSSISFSLPRAKATQLFINLSSSLI